MVRSGGGDYIELFESGLVAIGFGTPMDLTGLGRVAIRKAFIENNPAIAERTANGNIGMLHRFTNELKDGRWRFDLRSEHSKIHGW